jgi:O-antigen/teichoic acid export membrane protein
VIYAVRGYVPVVVVLAGAGFVVANVVSMLGLAILAGRRQLVRSSVAQVLGAASYAVMVASLLATHRASVGYVVLAAAVSTGVLGLVAITRGPRRRDARAVRDDYRAACRLGLPAMVGEVATLAVYRLDLAVVALLLTPADVGRYAVASSLAELLWIVPNGATQVLLPQVALDRRGRATAPLVLASTVVTLFVALALALAGPALVPFVFGHAYTAATNALPWLCVGATALGAWRLLLADLAARGHTAIRGITAGVAGVVMIALDFALIPVWGIGGAGVASLVAYVVAFGVVVRAWHVASERPVRELLDLGSAWTLVSQSLRSLLPSAAAARARAAAPASRP